MENISEKIADELFEKARRGNKESLHELKILGNNNDAKALSKLAEIYLKGLGGEKQLPEKAMEFLHRAAVQDYPPALYRLGDFYYYGKGGITVDAKKAVEYLTKAAELGEWKSYKLLGEIYLNNEGGIEADGYKVIDYMLKYTEEIQQNELPNISTKEEIRESLITAADIYLNGKCSVTQDGYKAIEIFAKAENWWDVARIYCDGKAGVAQSGSKAIEYFSRIEAWDDIAEIYAEGCGDIVPNREKAIEFYEKSRFSHQSDIDRLTTDKENLQELITLAKGGNAEALYELAEVYFKGLNGLEQSPQKALELLEKAAAQDYPLALYRLGNFYLYGKCGIKQNGYKAIALIQRADELDKEEDDEPDHSEWGYIYKEGVGGIKQDGQKAIEYFVKDFEENDSWESKNEILDIYLYGCGELKPDWRKAFEFMKVPPGGDLVIYSDVYFKFACVFDDKLGYFRKDGRGTLQVLDDRANRFEKLKAPNIIQANELERIAELYEEGYGGLTPNREKTIELYKKLTELCPRVEIFKIFKNKLAYLTETDDE